MIRRTYQRFVANGRRLGAMSVILLVALLVSSIPALAQFSGPALGAGTTINRTVVPTTDPSLLFPTAREVHLATGDLITIHLYGNIEYVPTVRVDLDGSVQLPLIGLVQVTGLSLHQAADLIAQRLSSAGMYKSPQVTIQVMESPNQLATVSGEMHGLIPVVGSRHLLDVLALAGGLPATASHTITIQRPGIEQPIVVELGTDPEKSAQANVPIFPGDTILVSKVGVVYLLGAFKNQGAIPLTQNSPLTLMQLASIGGGAGFEGKFSDLRIVRTTGTERKVVQVDIKKVIQGKAPDPVLQADDIVFLPTDAMKGAIKGGGVGTLLGIISVLVFAVR